MALSQSIWIALSSQPNPEVELHSLDFEESVNVPLEENYEKSRGWQEFLKGVLDILKQEGYSLSGWKGWPQEMSRSGQGFPLRPHLNSRLLGLSPALELGMATLEMARFCQRLKTNGSE